MANLKHHIADGLSIWPPVMMVEYQETANEMA